MAFRAMLCVLGLSGCQDTPLVVPVPVSISVNVEHPVLGLADTVPFAAVALDAAGRVLDTLRWPLVAQSRNPDVVELRTGSLIGRAPGSAQLVLRSGGIERTLTATVLPPRLLVFRDSLGTEVAVSANPDTLRIVVGDSISFRVRVESVPTRDLTGLFIPTWTVSDPVALRLSAAVGARISVVATDVGPVNIHLDAGIGTLRIPVRVEEAAQPP
ncbi:hypothetical protein Strain138_000681 [Pseudogemmatithrix spongiicola]|uniref:Uncharacterized protein n=1 Tax=Pseudogemmatithrix spongiicola TaxID=3062599 RepID=A0AA49Q4P3_9BACT|nr:hypothetical protein Strain138_000681 [Gemmatimonadaceae bacterium 'strain 138']WKW14340.1 hypothetical protein Strain318_000681 [Gemmatimonadaceae bacterium 'strain 318']